MRNRALKLAMSQMKKGTLEATEEKKSPSISTLNSLTKQNTKVYIEQLLLGITEEKFETRVDLQRCIVTTTCKLSLMDMGVIHGLVSFQGPPYSPLPQNYSMNTTNKREYNRLARPYDVEWKRNSHSPHNDPFRRKKNLELREQCPVVPLKKIWCPMHMVSP